MNTPESTTETDPVINISPNGNAILVVGPQAVRLRVHSLHLQSASKVFNAMLGPNWSEGQGLSEESPPTILLEEDDPEALRIICCVIHHRNDDLPHTLPPGLGTPDLIETGYLVASAFLFGDMDTLPWKTIYLLEERRTRMRAELAELLWTDPSCLCGWNKLLKERYEVLQGTYKPLEWLEVPISRIIGKMKVTPEELEPKRCSSNGYYTFHEVPTGQDTFQGKMEAMKKKASICLDCVHDEKAKSCRFKHG
ncbi:hypothetical protein B0T14DRAFT_537243 [Immersiella caudata]|uniref:BTB domain-containing protein n=1 Tax=Immersiella caudata TaxID=314043 RepID=A0AA39WQ39_9PEZI|nr:hypothetical protein B0T14DRAFT_537243 [Immersiella caudata]